MTYEEWIDTLLDDINNWRIIKYDGTLLLNSKMVIQFRYKTIKIETYLLMEDLVFNLEELVKKYIYLIKPELLITDSIRQIYTQISRDQKIYEIINKN